MAPAATLIHAADATAGKTASAETAIVMVRVAKAAMVKAVAHARTANKKARSPEIRKPKVLTRARHKNLVNRRHPKPPSKQGLLRLAKTVHKAKAVAAAAVVVADVIAGNVGHVRKTVLKA